MRLTPLLTEEFLQQDALTLAPQLVGAQLWRDGVGLEITETEAYPVGDSANHCRAGRTPRNDAMWGPGGRAYVYLCYGIHQLLNVVSGPGDSGQAVLIRAARPLAGLDLIQSRRGGRSGPVLLTGPGKVGASLALDRSWSHHPLFQPGGLELRARSEDMEWSLISGPRVGIAYASEADQQAPWRFALADCAWVSQRRGLR